METPLDLKCRQILMSAYLYYNTNHTVLSDAENDALIKEVVDSWADVPARYKPLLDPDMSSGQDLLTTSHHCLCTRQVESAALSWLSKEKNVLLPPRNRDYFDLTQDLIDEHEFLN